MTFEKRPTFTLIKFCPSSLFFRHQKWVNPAGADVSEMMQRDFPEVYTGTLVEQLIRISQLTIPTIAVVKGIAVSIVNIDQRCSSTDYFSKLSCICWSNLAGADIKEMENRQFHEVFGGMFLSHWDRLSRAKIPTIAVVSGYAVCIIINVNAVLTSIPSTQLSISNMLACLQDFMSPSCL